MNTTMTRRGLAAFGAAALLLTACGGSDDDAAPADEADAPAEEPADDATDDTADDTTSDDTTDDSASDDTASDEPEPEPEGDGGSGTFEPGGVTFRSVNLLDRPVDIYVRTTGLVEAFPVEAGVAPGAVTEYAAPPEGGNYVVTEAGAGDATCVTECDHFITNLSAAFGEGPTRTVLLYEDSFSGSSAFELSEEPESAESAAGSANLLTPADPSTGLVFPVGIALDEEVFGFSVGFEGVDGCVGTIDDANILVGGNQTPTYAYPGSSAGLLFFEQPDQDCEEPVADPVELTGGPGTRTLVVLQGAPPSLTFTTVELSGSVAGDTSAGGDESAAGGDDGEIPTGREDFLEALLSDAPPGTDEQCVADIVDSLSDDDIQVIVDNIDEPDLPADQLSPEGLAALEGILDCVPA